MLRQKLLTMGLGSESPNQKAVAKSDVGSTKDVVQALMETLVDPRLPSSVSANDPPSENAQKSVATQMHAVVLLYNYYHKKQNPKIEFLNFVSFCKLAVQLRPSLISFMGLSDGEYRLSLTEKAIKDACDISMALDASKDNPITEGYPISKVAVLLIDSKTENCLLQFGAITEGVWSLVEKKVNGSNINREIIAQEKVGDKRNRNIQKASIDDIVLLKLAFDAVKDTIGVDHSDLVVLDARVTYSLSKEKSATQVYMIKCPKSFSVNQSIPLKLLLESLEGPLVDRVCSDWTTTPVVEYLHMLPYVGSISCLLSGKDLCLPSLNVLDNINKYFEKKIESCDTIVDENNEDSRKKPKRSSNDKMAITTIKDGNFTKKFSKSCELRTVKDDNAIEKLKKRSNIMGSAKNEVPSPKIATFEVAFEKFRKRCELLDNVRKGDKESDEPLGDSLSGCSSNGPEDDVNLKVIKAKPLKLNDALRTDDKLPENLIAAKENQLVLIEANTKYNTGEQNVLTFEDSKNALALLYRKRQEVSSQIRNMGDVLVSCEDYIQRIRDGGDIGLARKCSESIITGNYQVLLKNEVKIHSQDNCNSQAEKQTRLSDIFVLGKSSCQDLDYICEKNNWRLPSYFLEPSNGKFESNVVVESKDLKLSSKGVLESSPAAARESAAAQMILKLHSSF